MYEKHFHDSKSWLLCCISPAPAPSTIALLHREWFKKTTKSWNSEFPEIWNRGHKYSNYYTLLNFPKNESFTIQELPRSTWGDNFECCFKERLFSLKRGKRDVRALSFELSKMSPQVGLAVLNLLNNATILLATVPFGHFRTSLLSHTTCVCSWCKQPDVIGGLAVWRHHNHQKNEIKNQTSRSSVAQLARSERGTVNPKVVGSIPSKSRELEFPWIWTT